MRDLRELLDESGCSTEFIQDAMRYEKLFKGDVEAFIDQVEEILMNEDDYEDDFEDTDDEADEIDPIFQSEYDYDGNDEDTYFEDEDGEEAFEEDDYEDDE